MPENDAERAVLAELSKEAEQRILLAAQARSAARRGGRAGHRVVPGIAVAAAGLARQSPARGKASTTITKSSAWTPFCVDCHEGLYGGNAESVRRHAGTVFDPQTTPFRVIRITMPYDEMRAAINRTRAILLAVGILTVFLAMVALYYVVKYIVIKPLNHLRDVSDAVAQGDLEQRADIHTNDEFEDLAVSFNKMLVPPRRDAGRAARGQRRARRQSR